MTFRWVAVAALLGIFASVGTSAAVAQSSDNNEGAWSKFMKSIGVKSAAEPGADINYTERSPLVVPPSRDLPPPASEAEATAPDWPKNSPKPAKQAKAKSKAEVLPDTAVQTPNPPFEKKPWYNPAGWFNKEEYATFNGEPVREHLTDPPAGYRIPSADQPYGISPDKKTKTQASAASPTTTSPPAAASPAAATPAGTTPAAATPAATSPAAAAPVATSPAAQPGK